MEGQMSFEFATSQRIVFGKGSVSQLGKWAVKLASVARSGNGLRASNERKTKVVVITGKEGLDRHTLKTAKAALDEAKEIDYSVFRLFQGNGNTKEKSILSIEEPTVQMAGEAVEFAQKESAEIVIGIGGGSAIDTGKAVAALVTQPSSIMEYMEVVGRGNPLEEKPLPFIAVPTTAGTGSEVTKNSVFDDPEANVKASLRDNSMLPTLAIVDPLLTLSVPASVTAATGLDALTQNIEPYVSNSSNPITDSITLEGIKRCSKSLYRCYINGDDAEAREDMCIASLFGGLALANAKLGAVHGFAGPLGGMIHGPHGGLCAAMLPAVLKTNVEVLQKRGTAAQKEFYLKRFDTIAQTLTGRPDATANHAVEYIADLCSSMEVKGLAHYGLTEDQFEEAIEKSKKSSSMKGNPIPLKDEELKSILSNSL